MKSPLDFGYSAAVHPGLVVRTRQDAIESVLRHGFLYSRKLSRHSSCVNALTFSNDGRWLASAGDDPYVLLWDFHQDDLTGPSHSFRGPRENVFALAFSASRQHLYSGDTDCMIYRYDMSRLSTSADDPSRYTTSYNTHADNIRSLSCHPELDDVFLSASEDGRVVLHDGRAGNGMSRAQATLQQSSELCGVQYHPTMPHIFVTGDKAGDVCLRDVRMAFGPLHSRSNEGVVQKFVTSLSKPYVDHLVQPEVGSLTFDRTGTKLCVTFLGYLPTIYTIGDPHPIAVCSGRQQPDGSPIPPGERTYANSCTIKHGSFGGPGLEDDSYYSAGSDDFRAYVWKIPSTEALRDSRQVVPEWNAESDINTVGFTVSRTSERYIPSELSQPHCRLTGHRSIVNTTLWHPHWPYLVTAGVERHILLHSPTSDSPCAADMSRTPPDVRALPGPNLDDRRRMIRALTQGPLPQDRDDDLDTIALFDEILRTEGTMDIFASRRWSPDSDDEWEERVI